MDGVNSMQELMAACRGRTIIAYGTGKVGKLLIPYLAENENVQICGVTNSWITQEDAGTFENTGLPVRSLRAWQEKLPEATILITTTRADFWPEIEDACMQVGYQNIIVVGPYCEYEFVFHKAHALLPNGSEPLLELLLPHIQFALIDSICIANEIQDVHRASFSEFRGCHKGQRVVLVGAGPALNYYSQLRETPHIGVNTAFLKPGIKLDYYFARDYSARSSWYNELKEYSFIKFFGICEWSHDGRETYQVPESIIEENHGRRFYTQVNKKLIHCDIEHHPIMGLGSVIFGALHFALFTQPKQILLVGCDCSPTGHFDGTGGIMSSDGNFWVNSWNWAKEFAARYFPSTEILSVNPVGLKGMFSDVYTESYLEANPEIVCSDCKILENCVCE